MGQWAFRKLNYLIDSWQAKAGYVYAENFQVFNVTTVGISPYFIGPSPGDDFAVNQRPVRIESAAFLLNTSSTTGPVDLPINIRDRAWWAAQQTKNIQTNVITDLYYDPTWPDGALYFWPVPNAGFQVRLQLWLPLQSYEQITDNLIGPGQTEGTIPQGYRNALMLTLAETLCPDLRLSPARCW